MIDWMIQLLASKIGLDVAKVLVYVVSFNFFLGGLRTALEYIADKTETDLDNKILKWVNKIMIIMTKAVDWMSANKEHKKK